MWFWQFVSLAKKNICKFTIIIYISNFSDSEVTDSESEHNKEDQEYLPRFRKRPSMSERFLGKLTSFLPTFPSFNLIKRSGGFHKYRRFPGSSPRPGSGHKPTTTTDGFNFRHRIGDDNQVTSPSPAPITPESFQHQIEQFRTGLLVTDPRTNFYKVSTRHEMRNTENARPGMKSDLRKNMIRRAKTSRRRPPPRRHEPSVSNVAGPPYPGPHPRNPGLPLDKTIIFP